MRGWVKIFSYTDPPTHILNYPTWQLYQREQWQTATVAEGQVYNKGIIARLAACQDRDQAMEFLGADIAVDRQQLPPLPDGEYYWHDLIGLTVLNRDGVSLGQVDHLLATGANDVLVVKGDRERLIPFLPERVILAVDLVERLLHVEWDVDF